METVAPARCIVKVTGTDAFLEHIKDPNRAHVCYHGSYAQCQVIAHPYERDAALALYE